MELLYVLLVAIVLVLAWRGLSLFLEWRSRLRLKIEPVPPGPDLESMPNPELGKVRVVHRPASDMPGSTSVVRAPEVDASTSKHETDDFGDEQRVTPYEGNGTYPDPDVANGVDADDVDVDAPVLVMPASVERVASVAEQQDMFADDLIAPPPDRKHTASRAQALYGATSTVEPVRPVAESVEKMPLEIEQVIALHVVCREHPFNGEDLLRAVLSYGLRFGDMSIFHRHEQPSGQGRVLFSMAKAVEPGIFDLETMTGEEIPGVSFFLGLPGVSSITAYDIMIDTARRLAVELQGDVLDEQQQPLTRQLVDHYRERVQEFERRRLMPRQGER